MGCRLKAVLFTLLLVYCISAVVSRKQSPNDIYNRRETYSNAALYPRSSETRDVKKLDGIWNFRVSPPDPEYGQRHGWFEQDLDRTGSVIPMPVPSSYNDVVEDAATRDHVGVVWYDRRFFVPSAWSSGRRVWLRFSSVHYAAEVYVNGKSATFHEIGHLPFQTDITSLVSFNSSNLLTVAVDNTLLSDTVPQGYVKDTSIGHNKVKQEQIYTFDFLNYAGIHRSVFLYSTPRVYIDDVIVNTDIQGLTGFIVYNVTSVGDENIHCLVQLFDKKDAQVTASQDCAGLLEIGNAHLWWPYLMHPDPGYLYTFKASIIDNNGNIIDTYSQKIGIRTVTWSNTTVYINEKPVYMRGFGMHEDSDIRGKGWDPVLWVKNFNLIKWVGANTFRTSHYPYAEEIYQMADEHGIMIIDECPSGDTDIFSDTLLKKHKQSLTELIRRDKNHPSVVAWSISNEPRSANQLAGPYFQKIVNHVKSMDLSRPVTIAISQTVSSDKVGQHLDVIMFNRYNGWYHNTGQLSTITSAVLEEATAWHKKYNKPVLMSEYGADTMAGLHLGQHLDIIMFNRYNGWYQNTGQLNTITAAVLEEATAWHKKHNKPVLMSEYGADTMAGLHLYPEYVWSEEYQVATLSEHFKAFDRLRRAGFFFGELIWNFADFKTQQTITRVGGNRKGIFTRSRQPKASAHHLRARYLALAASDAGAAAPAPMYYIADNKPAIHNEL